ncbi:PREDICTED: calcium-transporting ATPase 12, plasma membrane-type-like [Ipomoea nil]|uniref:calcium-transporting ATPase 12, plasma membrane-type-like n=1 Tax=Ipomoea nil TaxID=35883 RepID=UPI000900E801|nr:PREDICTED: calcium-transporting ATPase 12, plasma membrane-type-like [Ipomoea nil]
MQPIPATTMDIDTPGFSTIDSSGLNKLVRMKDQKWVRENGGIEGIISALETDVDNGIHGGRADLDARRKAFGSNFCPGCKPRKLFSCLVLEALKEPLIIILLITTISSLAFGILKNGLKEGCKEGLVKLSAILAVVLVSAGAELWSLRECIDLSDFSSYLPQVDVLRDGKWKPMSICRVVVGDIVFLKPGDQVPADGLFIEGCSLQVEKTKIDGQIELVEVDGHEDPFLFFGSTVVDGYARMLVTAVGMNKKNHAISIKGTIVDETKHLTSVVGKAGQAVALLTFLVLLARFFAGGIHDEHGNRVSFGGETKILDALVAIVGLIATPAMIALTATPEGLLLAVKITLAYSMRRLRRAGVLVREPSLCHSVASVTTICMNMTGTATYDSKDVPKFWLGLNSIEEVPHNLIATNVLELLHQGIGLNTTQPPSRLLCGSPQNSTEKAIFEWAVKHLGMDVETLKGNCTILEIEPFNSKNRQSGVLISKNADNTIHVHRKGAAEDIIPTCSHYYDTTGIVRVINKNTKVLLDQILEGMAENGMRCIAFAHRKTSIRDYFTFSRQQLILLGIAGLTSPRRAGLRSTLKDCRRAGVNFKLITGDNILTAKAIAVQCGILEPNHKPEEVVEGEEFRNFTAEERLEKLNNIRLIARAIPSDKVLMVECLKQKGQVVAFLGRGTGDVQALREAEAGLCFGTQGAEITKASSGVIMLNKEFPLLVDILKWSRGIYESIQVYTQFLLTATFVSMVLDFFMAVSASDPPNFDAMVSVSAGKVPYPVFQLLWIKLLLGILAAAALVVKKPSEELMHQPPRKQNEPLMTTLMIRTILTQALYQIAILLTIQFKGQSLFNINGKEKDTLILNTYILCQVFTIINARLFEMNTLEEIMKKKLFSGVIGLTIGLQVLMVEVLKRFAGTAQLSWGQWGTCISIAAASSPIGWLVKSISASEKPYFSNLTWLQSKTKTD